MRVTCPYTKRSYNRTNSRAYHRDDCPYCKISKRPIREFLWKLGLLPEMKCPWCGSRLKRSGFAGSNERFNCTKCKFGDLQ